MNNNKIKNKIAEDARRMLDLLLDLRKKSEIHVTSSYSSIIGDINNFDHTINIYYKNNIRRQYGDVDLNNNKELKKFLHKHIDDTFDCLIKIKLLFDKDPRYKESIKGHIGVIYNERFKKCIDCRYHKNRELDDKSLDVCTKLQKEGVLDDVVNGYYDVIPLHTTTCSFCRESDEEGFCGINAKFFEKIGFFRRIKKFVN